MRRWALFVLVLVAGCGPSGATHPGPAAQKTPASAQTPALSPARLGLLVVLEARGADSTFGGGPDAYDSHDVVAIVGTDGFAKAKQRFTPRALPFIGNAGTIMQPRLELPLAPCFTSTGSGW